MQSSDTAYPHFKSRPSAAELERFYTPTPQDTHEYIETLFTRETIGWDLITCRLPDMLQVA